MVVRPISPMRFGSVVKGRILMVENHAVFGETLIGEFLSDYSVDRLPTVVEAVLRFGRHEYSVLLVDYDLDDGKGMDVLRSMRALGATTPVIAISARVEGNEALVAAGARGVCHKMDFARIDSVIAQVARDT
ncbi:MAG: response regulator [Sandaracinus sp.]|nr:response regulator [Sandaracinus sp.]|tara:strand:+ start:358 stop:753 length:396 start_codon:yes stop_codon:yes gene_type:complete